MAHGRGDAPMLSKEALTESARLSAMELMDDFQIYKLFVEASGGKYQLSSAEKILTRQVKDIRKVGNLRAAPGDAERLETTKIGEIEHRILYQNLMSVLPSNSFSALAGVNSPTQMMLGHITTAIARQVAARNVTESQDTLLAALLRQLEVWCCNMLKSPTQYSLTVDGVAQTFATGINQFAASVDWDDPAAPIIGDLASFAESHTNQCGIAPSLAIYDSRLIKHLAKNTQLLDWGKRQSLNPLQSITRLPFGTVPDSYGEDMRSIVKRGYYQNSAGANTYWWDEFQMTFISFQKPGKVLGLATVPTEDDDHKGGFVSEVYKTPGSANKHIRAAHNGAPLLKNATYVTTYKLKA